MFVPHPPNSRTRNSTAGTSFNPGEAAYVAFLVFCLCDNGAGGGGLVLPGRRKDTDGLVVAGKTVDTGLDENETELGVLVLAVALKVLADSDSLGGMLVDARRPVDFEDRISNQPS